MCAADGLECPVDGSTSPLEETVDWWETCESLGGAELTPDECAGASDVLGWPKRGGVPSTFDILPRGCVVNLIKKQASGELWTGGNYQKVYLNYDNPDQTRYVGSQRINDGRQLLCKRTTGQKCYTSHEKPSFYLNRTVEGGWIPDGPRKHCRWKMEGSAIVAKDITSASGASLCLTANGDKTTASPDQYFSWRPHPAHPDRGYPTKCTDEVFTCVGAICYTKHQAHDHLTTCSTFHGAADLTLDECKNAAATLGLPVAADSWQGDEGWTNLPKGCVGNLGVTAASQRPWVYYNLPGPEVHADITAGRHLFCKKPPQMRCDEEFDAATNEPRGYVLEKPYGYRASYPQGAATWLKLQEMDGSSGGRGRRTHRGARRRPGGGAGGGGRFVLPVVPRRRQAEALGGGRGTARRRAETSCGTGRRRRSSATEDSASPGTDARGPLGRLPMPLSAEENELIRQHAIKAKLGQGVQRNSGGALADQDYIWLGGYMLEGQTGLWGRKCARRDGYTLTEGANDEEVLLGVTMPMPTIP